MPDLSALSRTRSLPTVAARVLTVDTARGPEALRRLAFWHVLAPVLATPLAATTGDTWSRPALLTVLACAFVLGVATRRALRRDPAPERVERLDTVVFWVDMGLLVSASAVAASSPLALLLIPVMATLRLGRRGAIVGVSLAFLAEAARNAVRVLLRGADLDLARSLELLVFAALVAGTISQLTRELDRRRQDAEREAAAARSSQQRMNSLHRIVMAGIGGGAESVIARVIHEVHVEYGYAGVSFALHENPGHLRFVGMAGASYPYEDVPLDPGGPAERVLAGEDAVLVTGPELDGIQVSLPDTVSLMVAPVRGRAGLLGVLIVECNLRREVPPNELATLQQLADQIGVLIEAARAFDREAQLAEELRRLDEMRRDFVSLTSHELRTPATAVVGFVETLLHRDITDPQAQRRLLEATARQAQRLTRLIDDLRTVSALDAGGMRVRLAPTGLDDVIATLRESVEREDVRLEGPRGVALLTDADRLGQVLTNLVENGLRHGAAPVTVRWRTTATAVEITVADAGPGIEEERRERVFERFETTSDLLAHHRGTGLGLPIARELTERMGGTLELVPSEVGATFLVRLPHQHTSGHAPATVGTREEPPAAGTGAAAG